MGEDSSGSRRMPPPPFSHRGVAKPPPPPTPAARMRTPLPMSEQPAESASGLLPLVETKKKFREITGEEFFTQFKKALGIICRSCGLSMQEFATLNVNGTLLFRRQEIAEFRNGAMEIPLEKLGDEFEVYGKIFQGVNSREIAAPSLDGLLQTPPGLFLRISLSGLELGFREVEETSAPPAPAPGQEMLLAACKVLAKMGDVDPKISSSISVLGDTIQFSRNGETAEIATIPEGPGEVRIYVEDLSWGADQCRVLLGMCGVSISEDKLAFIFMHKQVYFRVRENGFALCASNKAESEPSTYLIFHIE